MKKFLAAIFLFPLCLFAQGWQENFNELKTDSRPQGDDRWVVPSSAKLEKEPGGFRLTRLQGTPSVSRYIPYEFSPDDAKGANYLQIRMKEGSGRYLFTSSSLGKIQDWFGFKPGLYTIPLLDSTRPDLSKKKMKGIFSLSIYHTGFLLFDELRTVNRNGIDGVYFTVTDSKGNRKASERPITAGDTVAIEMPLKGKPDNLSLFLYRINDGKDWSRRGRWETLSLPGVPLELKESGIPDRYRAVFKMVPVKDGLKLNPGMLVAAVNYLGADSNDRGYYYGFCPYTVDLAAGKTPAEPSLSGPLKIYDFGPPDGPVCVDAVAVNKSSGAPGFQWVHPPQKYMNGFRKTLDALMMDWAEIDKGRSAEMEIQVKPGQYKVIAGIGAANTMCWLNQFYRPLSAELFVNGKSVFRANGDEKERFAYMNREARETDDLYDLYMMPMMHEVETAADCPDGKLRIRVRAGARKVPLNYVALYPADDRDSAEKMVRLRADRKKIFHSYWLNDTPSAEQLSSLSTAKKLDSHGKKFALFPRENPFEYIFLNSLPYCSEVGKPMKLLTAPGESGCGAILLRTFAPLKDVTVRISGLSPFPDAEIFYIMPYHFTGFTVRKHWIAPNHFMESGKRDFPENKSFGYWFRFRTPDSLKAGLYKGVIEVSGSGEIRKLPVEIRVISEKLPPLNDHLIAMLGVNGSGENLYKAMAFCRDHLGCNTVSMMCSWPSGSRFKTDSEGMPVEVLSAGGRTPESLKDWFENYKKAGFPVKTPFVSLQSMAHTEPYPQGPFKPFTPEYRKALELSYTLIRDAAKKYGGCTGIIADLGGEMGYGTRIPKQKTMDDAIRLFQLVSQIPDVKASYRCNDYATTEQFYPHLQIQGVRDPLSWPVSDRQSDFGKKKHLYTYSIEGRFLNGFHSWAHGARGNLREWLVFNHSVEYNDFICCGYCGGTFHFEAMPAPDGNFLPTLRSEAFRASVADRQYLRLLENAAAASKYPEITKNAEAFLSTLRSRIFRYEPIQGIACQNANNPWPGIRLDTVREIIAAFVRELKTGKKELPEFENIPVRLSGSAPEAPPELSGECPPEARLDCDDSFWASIQTGSSWEKQGIQYDGIAWYRKEIAIPDGWKNPVLYIGAADEQAWVFCNEKYLGHHDGWDKPFSMVLDNVPPGKTALVAIRVFDSANMGGIWQPVLLYKNESDAKRKENGILLNTGWKIALRPGKRDLNTFDFLNGPFLPQGLPSVEAEIRVVPNSEKEGRDLAFSDSKIEVVNDSGQCISSTDIGKLQAYMPKKVLIKVQELPPGRYSAVLKTSGQKFGSFRFYVIPAFTP